MSDPRAEVFVIVLSFSFLKPTLGSLALQTCSPDVLDVMMLQAEDSPLLKVRRSVISRACALRRNGVHPAALFVILGACAYLPILVYGCISADIVLAIGVRCGMHFTNVQAFR